MTTRKVAWRSGLLGAMVAALAFGHVAASDVNRQLTVEQTPMAAVSAPQSTLQLTAWTERADRIYVPGETLNLYLRLSHDARVTVLNVNAVGQTTVLFPNAHAPDAVLAGNRVHRIPAEGAPFQFGVSQPFGTNLIKVIATTAKVPVIDRQGFERSGAFDTYQGPAADIARQLHVVVADQPQAAWAMAEEVFEVAAQRPAKSAQIVAPIQLGGGQTNQQPWALPSLDSAFGLELRTSKQSYRLGESLSLNLVAEKNCKLTLLNVDTAGTATVLYPNQLQQEVSLQSGRVTFLPDSDSPIRLQLAGSPGPQNLVALCMEEHTALSSLFSFDPTGRAVYPIISGGQQLSQALTAAMAGTRRVAQARAAYLVTD